MRALLHAHTDDAGDTITLESSVNPNTVLVRCDDDGVYITAATAEGLVTEILRAVGKTGVLELDLRPPAPTAPGLYKDRDGDYWVINEDGDMAHVPDRSFGGRLPTCHGPYTRVNA